MTGWSPRTNRTISSGIRRRRFTANASVEKLVQRIESRLLSLQRPQTLANLRRQSDVRTYGDGFFPTVELVRTDQNSSRAAVSRNDDLLVPVLDRIHEAAELCLGFG